MAVPQDGGLKMLDTGEFNHFVEIQGPTQTLASNGTGDRTTTFQTVAEVWASIKPQSVNGMIAARQQQSEVTHRVIIRKSDIGPVAISQHYRLLCEGVAYKIIGLLPDAETGNEYVTLACSARVFVWADS